MTTFPIPDLRNRRLLVRIQLGIFYLPATSYVVALLKLWSLYPVLVVTTWSTGTKSSSLYSRSRIQVPSSRGRTTRAASINVFLSCHTFTAGVSKYRRRLPIIISDSRSRAVFNPFSEIDDDNASDAALVEQAKNGDRAALEKLVLRHQAQTSHVRRYN